MNNHYSFIGGSEGSWRVTSCETLIGIPLEIVERVNVVNMPSTNLIERGTWVLQGLQAMFGTPNGMRSINFAQNRRN